MPTPSTNLRRPEPPAPAELDAEAERLFRALMHVDCEPGRPWNYDACRRIAPLTLEISGSVPKTELREAALGVARREMARSRDDFRIEDRIEVDPGFPRAA